MDTKDFPVPNKLIDECAKFLSYRFGSDEANPSDFKHALHQLIHDYNGELAKAGFTRQLKKSAWKKLDDSVESLKDFQAETVESIMGAAPEKMRNSIESPPMVPLSRPLQCSLFQLTRNGHAKE